jgi:hypothetical protein
MIEAGSNPPTYSLLSNAAPAARFYERMTTFDHLVGASEIDQPCMVPIQPAMARPISSGESS